MGHVSLSPFTMVQPQPPRAGTINLWQLFVRPPWQGRGIATQLMRAAEAEARRRGFMRMRPVDAARCGSGQALLRARRLDNDRRHPR